jgi:GGDEF domain-containing protein
MVRISRAVSAVHAHGEPVRMSLGGAIAARGVGADEVVRLADEAMYRAKRARNGLQTSG